MELIIGGAFQGKMTYAAEKYGLCEDEFCDLKTALPRETSKCVYHLEAFTRAAVKQGMSAEEVLDRLSPLSGFSAIVSREIGNGIVPMDAEERAWRELHGAVLRMIAAEADTVTRVFCGIAEELK